MAVVRLAADNRIGLGPSLQTPIAYSSRRWMILVFFLVCLGTGLGLAGDASAQGLLSFAQKQQTTQQPETTPEELQNALGVVIQTLQDDAQRRELLQQLEALKEGAKAAENTNAAGQEQGGLLGALNKAAQASEQINALDFVWIQRTKRAFEAVRDWAQHGGWFNARSHALQIFLWLVAWLVVLSLLVFVGTKAFQAVGWSQRVPRHPRFGLSVAHLVRQILPWALTFFGMLWLLPALATPMAVQAAVLIIIYIGLCGRTLSAAAELVISWFSDGHRRVAAQILLRRTLKPLFAIGALVALSDAIEVARLQPLLNQAMAQWLSDAANLLAAATSAWLVLHNRRPVAHLIRNRSFARRHENNLISDLVRVVARIWAPSTLFAVSCSVVAVVATGVDAAFSRAALCAVLLLGMLLANALLLRHRSQVIRRPIRGSYKNRLLRFAYVLAIFLGWVIFAEIILWVWGYSLQGFGSRTGISPLIGRSLFGLGLTILLAWLLWIFADIAIQRTLHRSGQHSDKSAARAQTVTPMLRNVVFFTIVVITAVVALANLGVNVTPLLAGAGVIGLALGFGAQNLIQDLITGVFIVIEDSIAVGDFIKIGSYMGTVEGLNLRTVRLRDLDAVVHHITYSHIDSIHNMSREFGVALLKIRLPHDMPIDNAVTLMRETAMELRKDSNIGPLIHSPLEMQGIDSFDEGCPILRMRMRTQPEWQWDVGRAFNLLLKQRMERQQMTLGAPRLTVNMVADGGKQYGSSAEAIPEINPSRPGGP